MRTVTSWVILFCYLVLAPKSQDLTVSNPSQQSTSTLDCDTVQFYLATKDNPDGELKACLNQTTPLFNGHLDPTKPTKVLVHGWMNNKTTDFTAIITRSFLKVSDVNLIQVDWSAIANYDYVTSRIRVSDVGLTVAAFIKRITQELKVKFSDLHLIGHSLGSQIAGVVGYQLQSPNKIRKVTGLDPAGPLFWTTGNDGMISKESGEFVVILHTCAGLLGTKKQLGHVDFYANGGTPIQPGCEETLGTSPNTGGGQEQKQGQIGFCSHDRAISYFAESIEDPKAFDATRCTSYIFYKSGLCKGNEHVYFNENVTRKASGKYFFNTRSSYPFKLSSC